MDNVLQRIAGCLICACFLFLANLRLIGVLQQAGYKNGGFLAWLKRKDNLYFNRLAVLALCLALTTAVTVLCFSFLDTRGALLVSALPFFGLLLLFWRMDTTYALKVPTRFTGRLQRLFAVYVLFTASVGYFLVAMLGFLAEWNGSVLYGFIAYVPFAVMPILTPILLILANGFTSIFEEVRNRRFVKRAGQVLDEQEIIRIGVVGSYGKT